MIFSGTFTLIYLSEHHYPKWHPAPPPSSRSTLIFLYMKVSHVTISFFLHFLSPTLSLSSPLSPSLSLPPSLFLYLALSSPCSVSICTRVIAFNELNDRCFTLSERKLLQNTSPPPLSKIKYWQMCAFYWILKIQHSSFKVRIFMFSHPN